jgi:Rps23 Pro-64 3,4-dihydroxylase Tpa1-like proline 4-hydroxylase
MTSLLEINPDLDRAAFASEFARAGRLQVPNVLTLESAAMLRELLQRQTRWPVAWAAGDSGAQYIQPEQFTTMTPQDWAPIDHAIFEAGRRDQFSYLYWNYPLVIAFEQKWSPGSPHEQLREELRSDPFASLLRDLTGHSEIVGADGYATLYGPRHFLSTHDDRGSKWRRVVAYVLNLTFTEWHPDFGGYLTFYDANGDVDLAFKPKFNTLNIFSVPQLHSVTRLAPFAPAARAAISGWARETLQPPPA